MKRKSLVLPIALVWTFVCSGTPATAGADAPLPLKSPDAATAEKAPKAGDIAIGLKAPIFSPLFAKVPLAKVNDDLITVEDLNAALGKLHSDMEEGKAAQKIDLADLLKRLINSRLFIQEAHAMGLEKLEANSNSINEFSKAQLQETLLKQLLKKVRLDEKEAQRQYLEKIREWRLKSLIFAKPQEVAAFQAALKSGRTFEELYDEVVKDGRAVEGAKADSFIGVDNLLPEMLRALETMKPGAVSSVIAQDKRFLLFKYLEMRSRENPALKEQMRDNLLKKTRLKALEAYRDALVKKHVKQHKTLIAKLDFESKKQKFENFLNDKRAIAEIKGEKPVTVADLATAVRTKFYHGVSRAAEGKKINGEKGALLLEILGPRAIEKEARAQHMENSEEYRAAVQAHLDTLMFGSYIEKVVLPDIAVTAEEVQAYYRDHQADYTTQQSYKLEAIAFEKTKDAEAALEKLRKGTDFKWYKDNAEGQANIAGNLLFLLEGKETPQSNLPLSLQNALAGVAAGDYRIAVDGKTSYVMLVDEVKAASTLPVNAVEKEIQKTLYYEKLNKGVEAGADKLRAASEVTIYADFSKQEKP